jgi:L-fuculose-phosphate aldolase
MEYNSLQPEDIVCVDANGSVLHDPRKPSSEWPFHLGIYSTFPDVEAVVHCHSRHATALACAGEKIPAFHYMVAVAGGKDIPLTDYALFGTAELSANVVAALRERKACLLANHGQVATGMSLVEALELAFEVEELAAQYCEVCKLGKANILSDAQMDEVLAAFGNYGQQ